MLNERIEPFVFRDDVKVCGRISGHDLTNVESDVKIKRVRTVPEYLDVLNLGPQPLNRGGYLVGQLGLTRSDEQHDLKVILVERRKLCRLNTLEVDQDVVGSQLDSLTMYICFLFHRKRHISAERSTTTTRHDGNERYLPVRSFALR